MAPVVITGMGACTSIAANASELWRRAARLPPCEPEAARRHGDRSSQVDQADFWVGRAAGEALTDAGLGEPLSLDKIDPARAGCTVSASKPLFETKGGAVVSPEIISDGLCKQLGIRGERRNVIAACATGAYSVALGASWIEQDLCDVVLAGSVEPAAHPLIEAGFKRMGVVTSESVMRPFDRRRSGFILAAGAGVVVLESETHAARRGAAPRARLSGWGWGVDAHSAVAFNSNGQRIADVIRQALRRAGLAASRVQHVNAHGTATVSNDSIETQALIKAFGSHAARLMISATKSSTGHLLGAAGSIELILAIQALTERYIPPTAHLEEPDPDCPLDYTPQRGHAADIDHALSLSFGFGGPIGALIVSRA